MFTAALAGFLLAGGVSAASAAPSAQGVDELPPVTISSTTLRAGETVSISGTGCVDPDIDSGEGLVVHLIRPGDFGRGGTALLSPMLTVDVQADGTFEGSTVVEQPLFPDGPQTGLLDCRAAGDYDATEPAIKSRPIDLVIEAPSLPDLTVAAGSTIDYELPCSIPDGGYGAFTIAATADGQQDFFLSVRGAAPPAAAAQKGEQVQLEVPSEASPGTYEATASCFVSQAGTSAYFTGFTVTVTGPDAPSPEANPDGADTPTPDPSPTAPDAATPVAGAPNFTG